jgi:ankyrin repeat protein
MAKATAVDWKPIMDAAFAGDAAGVARQLAGGVPVDVRSPNSHRHTPLVRAVEWKKSIPRTAGHHAVAEVLLAAGANPHLTGGVHRWTPLAHALMGDEAELVPLLLPQGPHDLAHLAMAYDVKGVRAALRRKATVVDARDEVGRTALHYLGASGLHRRQGSVEALAIAGLLLDAGADPNAAQSNLVEDGWVATPLWWAVGWQDHRALAERLLAAGADAQPGFFAAAFDGDADMLALLLDHGACVAHRVQGRAVLMDLMRFKRPRHVAFLLARGADARATDADGDTALHAGVRSGVRPDVLALLIAHGADPDQANAAGETPRSLAKALGRVLVDGTPANAGKAGKATQKALARRKA